MSAAESPVPATSAPTAAEIEARAIEACKRCYDPEIPVNIYDLGLVYSIDVAPDATVAIKMTLTAPGCPVAGSLPGDVERMVKAAPGVKDAKV